MRMAGTLVDRRSLTSTGVFTLTPTPGGLVMTDGSDTATDERTQRPVREILPRSASIIEAFRNVGCRDHPHRPVLGIAHDLATHHQRQWEAEDVSRHREASADAVARAKRLIDELNARRVGLVERIDRWVAQEVRARTDCALHTETLGSVVDRLAIAWIRTNTFIDTGDARDRARLALRQLAELAEAYDDLVRDVAAGRRRLPEWVPLKSYRSAP